MIAVGIDVSKSKSTVAILNGDGSIRAKPFDVHHVADELQALVDYTSQQAIFNRRAAAREGENTEVVPASYACYECFYPLGSYHLLRRKSDFAKLTQKKNAATSKKITTLSKSCSVLSRTFLFALFFDFGNLLCRCGYNPYALIAHTVQQRVKLPPIGRFLRVAVRKEKLIYRNMITGYKVIEHLQTRLLSLVLNIRKVARGNI